MDKPLSQSMTVWSGFVLIGLGVFEFLAGHDPTTAGTHIMTGLGFIGLRRAV